MTDIVPRKTEGYTAVANYARDPRTVQVFSNLFGRQGLSYIESVLLAVKENETLQLCEPKSIFNSALRAATLKLSCDPALGQAWIIPYKNGKTGNREAKFQVGWRGVMQMAIRTGKYAFINADSYVYEGEVVEFDRITGDLKINAPDVNKIQFDKKIGLIASFQLMTGYKKAIYMSIEELEEHGKKYSKSYSRSDSIWKTNKDAAYKKTILLKLLRTYGILDADDSVYLDAEQIEEPQIDVAGSNVLPDGDEVVVVIEREPMNMKEATHALGFEVEEEEIEEAEFIVEPAPDPLEEYLVDEIIEKPKAKPKAKAKAKQTNGAPGLPVLTIEEAYSVTNSQGVKYGETSVKVLEKMLSAMWKQVHDNGLEPDEKAVVLRKISAAKTVMEAKQDGSIQ